MQTLIFDVATRERTKQEKEQKRNEPVRVNAKFEWDNISNLELENSAHALRILVYRVKHLQVAYASTTATSSGCDSIDFHIRIYRNIPITTSITTKVLPIVLSQKKHASHLIWSIHYKIFYCQMNPAKTFDPSMVTYRPRIRVLSVSVLIWVSFHSILAWLKDWSGLTPVVSFLFMKKG